jgi:hypothetical protein
VSPFTPISLFRLDLAQDRNPLARIPAARKTPEGGRFAGLAQDRNPLARIPAARKTPEGGRFAGAAP